jgi:dTDP-4-dehydrorhamnose 3,5-epimerase
MKSTCNAKEKQIKKLQSPEFVDDRGKLSIIYENNNIVLKESFSKAGVLRGLHWQQSVVPQTKMIRVVTGEIIDIVMDVGRVSKELVLRRITPQDGWFIIDKSLAHGFYAVEDAIFEYLCIGQYDEEHEVSYNIKDAISRELNIEYLIQSKKDINGKKIEIDNLRWQK